ncbi:MAG TPA: inositol monophosphatase family protein [Catenuloplanes sp.]|jgi:fructose-1,6-bisphosphatase/inositol monophosphatase family enzyme
MIEQVGELVREAARTAVEPLFRRLADDEISEKAPGEVVTVADRRSEEILTAGLQRLLPGSLVVGEEGTADDPTVLDRLRSPGMVWLVDPLDGTSNFAAGRTPFAVMVALLRGGAPVASWILDVMTGELAVAELGSGAYLDGVRVSARADAPSPDQLTGAVMSRFLPQVLRVPVERAASQLGKVSEGLHCAGREYPDIVADTQQFVLFWRTLPWDHAPGTLFVREAGGTARRFDGTDYLPGDDRPGLLVAANEAIWHAVHDVLLVDDRAA